MKSKETLSAKDVAVAVEENTENKKPRRRNKVFSLIIISAVALLLLFAVVPVPYHVNMYKGGGQVMASGTYVIVMYDFPGMGTKVYPLPYALLFQGKDIHDIENIWNYYESDNYGLDFKEANNNLYGDTGEPEDR